ncbi:hypothetical protein BBP40_011395 [Aspergillus hancockii]|nr:hypothetical protein BBP40_011395 [Aspergillus hancockii]
MRGETGFWKHKYLTNCEHGPKRTTMIAAWSIDYETFGKQAQSYVQKLGLLVIILGLLILVIDHVEFILRAWPLRKMYHASTETNLLKRFRKTPTSREQDEMFRIGYDTCSKRGKAFVARAELNNWRIMLPPGSIKEWCNLSQGHLSFQEYNDKTAYIDIHTKISPQHAEAVHLCNKEANLNCLHQFFVKETDELLPISLGKPKSGDWAPFKPAESCSDLFLRLAISWVMGPRFARDEHFVQTVATLSDGIEELFDYFAKWPRFLLRLLWRLSPVCRNHQSKMKLLKQKLVPEIKHQLTMIQAGKDCGKDASLLTELLKLSIRDGIIHEGQCSASKERRIENFCMQAVFYVYEFWGGTFIIVYLMLARVMADPEYRDALREEISTAFASVGEWQSDFLGRTPKLESFVRETLRLHIPVMASASRRVIKPVYLKSLDMTLEKGMSVALPTRYIQTDPEFYSDPNTFDPYRFYDPISNTATPRATTVSNHFLAFSIGSNVCPGRFLAVRTAKMVFAKFLMNYDMKFADENQGFPESAVGETGFIIPDLTLCGHVRAHLASSSEI